MHAGVDVLDEEAIARLPRRATTSGRPSRSSQAEGKLFAFRHEGLWLTVNTPKDLRAADEHVRANPNWLAAAAKA